jgi:hypothetical protein
MQPRTVLFFASNPASTEQLGLLAEFAAVRRALLRYVSWWDGIEIIPEWSLADDLLAEVRDRRPEVLHFAGHGASDGGMVLRPLGGETLATDAPATADYLRRVAAPRVALVVLNLCHSDSLARRLVAAEGAPPDPSSGEPPAAAPSGNERGPARDLLAAVTPPRAPAAAPTAVGPESIDVAIGMEGAIADAAALAFSASFYQALAAGASIGSAFSTAKSRIEAERLAPASPRLHARAGVDPEKTFVRPRGLPRPVYVTLAWTTLLAAAFFVAQLSFYRYGFNPALDPTLDPAPSVARMAANALVLWLVATCAAVLASFYRLGRVARVRRRS